MSLNVHDAWPLKDGLRVGHLNINSVINKLADVSTILSNNGKNFHVFGFSESRLSSHISDAELSIPGYNIIRKDADGPNRTGLLIYVNQCLTYKLLPHLNIPELETLWLEVSLKKHKPVLICLCYRNPNENSTWIDNFDSMMDALTILHKEIILIGDFNIDLLRPQKKWHQTYDLHNLHQLIHKPTRVTPTSKTLIDHIYVTDKQNIIEACVPVYGCSDHFPVCVTWSRKGVKIPKVGHKTITYRSYTHFNVDHFNLAILNSALYDVFQIRDPDKALEYWIDTFNSILDQHAPHKTKRVRHTIKPKWLTAEIQAAIHHRDYLLKNGQREEYKKERNKTTSLIRAAKKKYFEDLLASKNDSKTVWKAINELTHKKKSSVSTYPDDLTANKLNEHFTSISEQVISHDNVSLNDLSKLKQFCSNKITYPDAKIPPMSVHDVYKALTHLKQTGAHGPDGLDGKIIKLCAPAITETLTYVYNLCLDKKVFPSALKIANVTPLHKSGDSSNPSNYRPISILSVLSKPLEKHINKHLLLHLNSNNLLHPNQSGFRKKHSCHTALTSIVDKWLQNINQNEFCGALFVDFKKAFDVIDHSLLLLKLEIYGYSADTLSLLTSFLADRQQYVHMKSSTSTLLPLHYGVPQGSILGPLLFSIYINDLPLHIQSALCELFADDTTIHTSNSKLQTVSQTLQTCVDNLIEWTNLNHMALHPGKTKCMVITTRQKRQNLQTPMIPPKIQNKAIEEVSSHKVLGVTIDNNLSWMNHINNLCKSLSRKVFQLSKVKHFLNFHARVLFFHAHIQSLIDYASTLWDGASANTLKPLMSLHKRSLKLILKKPSTLTTEDYKILQILPLQLKFSYNKGILMHKIMSNLAPPTLTNTFQITSRHDSQKVNIPLPRIDLFKTSLVYSGGSLWNSFPNNLKSKSNSEAFRIHLKTYLFEKLES